MRLSRKNATSGKRTSGVVRVLRLRTGATVLGTAVGLLLIGLAPGLRWFGEPMLKPGNLILEMHWLEVFLLALLSLDVALRTLALLHGPRIGIRLGGGIARPVKRRLVIGRDRKEVDIVVRDTGVSSRHAELRRLGGGQVEVLDLGSRNGTWVAGRDLRVSGAARLRPGDQFRLGMAGPLVQVRHLAGSGLLPISLWTLGCLLLLGTGLYLGWHGNHLVLPEHGIRVGDVTVAFEPFLDPWPIAGLGAIVAAVVLAWNLMLRRAGCSGTQHALARGVQVLAIGGAVLLYPLMSAQGAHYARLAQSAHAAVGAEAWSGLEELDRAGESPCSGPVRSVRVPAGGAGDDAGEAAVIGVGVQQVRRYCIGRRHLRLGTALASRQGSNLLATTYFRQVILLFVGLAMAFVLPLRWAALRRRIGAFIELLPAPLSRRLFTRLTRGGRLARALAELLHWDMVVGLVAALLVLLTLTSPVGVSLGRGQRLFLSLPGLGTVQTIEIVKILFVLFVAGYFGRRGRSLQAVSRARYLLPFVIASACLLGLTGVQGDMGGLLILSLFLVAGFVACGGPMRVLVVVPTLLAVGMGAAVFVGRAGIVMTRLSIWLSPTTHPRGDQIVQARQLMLSSGALGHLPANALAWRIPDIHGDLTMAAVAERFGLVGFSAVLLAVFALVAGLLMLARVVEGTRSLLFTATAALLMVQVATQTGGLLGLTPFTGAPFPWISHGLTGTLAFTLLVGLCSILASERGCPAAAPEVPSGLGARPARPALLAKVSVAVLVCLLAVAALWSWWLPQAGRLGDTGVTYRWIDVARKTKIADLTSRGVFRRVSNSALVEVDLDTVEALRQQGELRLPEVHELVEIAAGLRRRETGIEPLPWLISSPNRYADRSLPPGSIVDRDGVVLAMTDRRGRRHYPLGAAAFHPVGKMAGVAAGSGLEEAASALLRGQDYDLEDRLRAFSGDVHTGPDLRSTLDAGLQRLAFELLAGRSGAAVVMDPADGALLALASSPAPDLSATAGAAWRDAARSPEQPLRNRALVSIHGYSPPGSAFKPVVAMAALTLLEDFDPDAIFYCPGSDDELRVSCPGHRAHGAVTLGRALTVSCNVYFGRLAVRLGVERLRTAAAWFGFDRDTPLSVTTGTGSGPLNAGPSSLAPAGSFVGPDWALARLGFGQGPVTVTPLQMAQVAGVLATGGHLLQPHLIDDVELARRDEEGQRKVVWRQSLQPPAAPEVVAPGVATRVADMLINVFEPGGTAGALPQLWLGPQGWELSEQSPGPAWIRVPVAGKTGSAWQTNNDPAADAWIFAWAPASQPQLVVTVMLENAGGGARFAGPVAMELLRAGLNRQHWAASVAATPAPAPAPPVPW